MIDWNQLEQDREAGTPGSWSFIESVSPDGQEWLGCGVEDNRGVEFLWLESFAENDIPLCRRIARVPDLEALAFAGRELARQMREIEKEAARTIEYDEEDPIRMLDWFDTEWINALSAWDKAVKGETND